MDGIELTLQGEMIVLETTDGLRTITKVLSIDEADELAQILTELVIEADLESCPADDCDDDDDVEDEAA
jgi:hypothetical protein